MPKSQACCTVETYIIRSTQLPLSCPMRTERIWDAHPRIYLPIEKKGRVVCPYCGTRYILESLPDIQSSSQGGVVPPGKTWNYEDEPANYLDYPRKKESE